MDSVYLHRVASNRPPEGGAGGRESTVGMTRKLRDAALGAATVALLLYAAMTAARNISGTVQAPAQGRAGCAMAAPACGQDTLQVARNRDQ